MAYKSRRFTVSQVGRGDYVVDDNKTDNLAGSFWSRREATSHARWMNLLHFSWFKRAW